MNFNQTTIYSNNPAEKMEFYCRLGLKIIVDSMPRYTRLQCPDGDATLSIHIAEEPVLPKLEHHFIFRVRRFGRAGFGIKNLA